MYNVLEQKNGMFENEIYLKIKVLKMKLRSV